MKPITYIFEGKSHAALTDHYLFEGYKRYLIKFGNEQCFIVPSKVPNPDGSIIWAQHFQDDEKIQPNELIQALGDGLHDAEKL